MNGQPESGREKKHLTIRKPSRQNPLKDTQHIHYILYHLQRTLSECTLYSVRVHIYSLIKNMRECRIKKLAHTHTSTHEAAETKTELMVPIAAGLSWCFGNNESCNNESCNNESCKMHITSTSFM